MGKQERKQYNKEYYEKNKEKFKESHKKFAKKYYKRLEVKERIKKYYKKPKVKERIQKYNSKHKIKRKYDQLRINYNLNIQQYNKMVHKQKGICPICKKDYGDKLGVDHNHETKEIRGLLCRRCNLLLGQSDEDINLLKNMIKYIKKYDL